jgi:hypothetical protein
MSDSFTIEARIANIKETIADYAGALKAALAAKDRIPHIKRSLAEKRRLLKEYEKDLAQARRAAKKAAPKKRAATGRKLTTRDLPRLLEEVRRRFPAEYEQISMMPFGFIPSHAQEDPRSPWWRSNAAKARLRELAEILA